MPDSLSIASSNRDVLSYDEKLNCCSPLSDSHNAIFFTIEVFKCPDGPMTASVKFVSMSISRKTILTMADNE